MKKRSNTWARFSTRLTDHPQITMAGAELGRHGRLIVLGLFVVSVLWSRKHRTSGLLPETVVAQYLRASKRQRKALVAAGLWQQVENGYRIRPGNYWLADLAAKPRDRRGVNLKLRFDVLQRDSSTCQYCGRRAPEVEVEVDHIVPVAAGGTDVIDNLVTACCDCNSGKAARPRIAAVTK